MAYTRTTWVNGSGGGTPISAANLNNIEAWIDAFDASVPGQELAYAQITANVSVTATAEASATSVVSAGAVSFDGSTTVMIEFFSPLVEATTQTWICRLVLYDGSSSIGYLAQTKFAGGTGEGEGPVYVVRRLTPSNASHTYSVRAYMSVGTAGTVYGGTGGSGQFVPAYIRIIKVA